MVNINEDGVDIVRGGLTFGAGTTADFTNATVTGLTPSVDLTAFSVGAEASASGDGGIAYNNSTGVFTYTPPDLSGYQTTLIKAYAHVDVSSPITASADYNVASVTSSVNGKYDVTFTTALPNANYVVMLSVQTNVDSNNYTVQYYNRTTTGFQVQKFLNGTLDGGASGNFSFVIIQT